MIKGIMIKGMEMPSGCLFCQFEHGIDCNAVRGKHENIRQYIIDGGRPNDCPLTDLPDGLYQVQGEKIWKYHGKGEKK